MKIQEATCGWWIQAALALVLASSTTMRAQTTVSWSVDWKTQEVVERFHELNRIPRGPGNELGVRTWLQQWGKTNGFQVRTDDTGNVFIRVGRTDSVRSVTNHDYF